MSKRIFREMTPGERDKLVMEMVRTYAPISTRKIGDEMCYPPLEITPDERSIDCSLQRLRRAGFIHIYPKRGLWSVVPR